MHHFAQRLHAVTPAVLALTLCSPPDARAEDYATVPMEPGATLSLWSSQVQSPGRYALALGLQARSIAVPGAAGDAAAEREGSASTLELMGTLGVWERLDVSAAIALERMQLDAADGATSEEGSSALGDVRLVPRVRVLGGDGGSGLALLVPMWKAGGDSPGDDGALRVEPRLATSLTSGPLTALVNAGYQVHTRAPSARSAITGGAGAELFISESWALLGEVLGSWVADDRGAERRMSAEARLGARYANSGWAAQFGAGRGVSGAAGEPDWRLLASVSFSPSIEEPTVTVAPTALASAEPEEVDYLRARADWQPPEEADAAAEVAATPGPEALGATAGQSSAEPPPSSAVPEADGGEGSASAGAAVAETGEDESAARQVFEMEIHSGEEDDRQLPGITQVIRFVPNQMRLDGAQLAALDDVAQQMLAAPRDARLIVEGHSDSAGPAHFNWRLSRMRASTVRYHLIQRGVPWQHIWIRAYGASRPADVESAETGQANHRRVEFRVVRGR